MASNLPDYRPDSRTDANPDSSPGSSPDSTPDSSLALALALACRPVHLSSVRPCASQVAFDTLFSRGRVSKEAATGLGEFMGRTHARTLDRGQPGAKARPHPKPNLSPYP